MAKRFLTHIDLQGNQLLNAAFEKLTTDPTTGNFEGRIYYNTTDDTLKLYDGTNWIPVGAITDINGTTDEIEVSIVNGVATISLPATINANTTGNASTASALETARDIELTGDVTGTASFDGSGNIQISTTIGANTVELGTDTTGDYVESITAGDGISITGSGEGAAITIDNTGVLQVNGTTNEIDASTVGGVVTLSLPTSVTFPGEVTLNADPTQALHAVTKQYVDGIAAGLDWHQAVNLLYDDPSAALTGSTGTLTIDGHSALTDANDGYRVLVTSASGNSGIYTYNDNGTTWTLNRAADADIYEELVGSAVFVMEGTNYGATAWIQTNHYLSDFTGQQWTQFSGAGTYVAGNGLQLDGNSFSINTDVTVDVNSVQTLTNKTLTSPEINNPTISGLYISDNTITIEGTTDSFETTVNFTDPTADRTITFKDASGTVALTSDIDALTTSDIEEGTNLYFTDERAQDAVGGIISGSNSLSATYTDSSNTIAFDTTLATTSYMSKTSGLAVDISALETKLTTDGYTKKVSATVGNGAATSFAITHNLGTRDVQVQIYDAATHDTVECDVVRDDVNTVTVGFSVAPATNSYRVVIVG